MTWYKRGLTLLALTAMVGVLPAAENGRELRGQQIVVNLGPSTVQTVERNLFRVSREAEDKRNEFRSTTLTLRFSRDCW
jgi:hypothetical protein